MGMPPAVYGVYPMKKLPIARNAVPSGSELGDSARRLRCHESHPIDDHPISEAWLDTSRVGNVFMPASHVSIPSQGHGQSPPSRSRFGTQQIALDSQQAVTLLSAHEALMRTHDEILALEQEIRKARRH